MPRNFLAKAEILIIILLACIPLFIRLPYRVNIFLSWEGAYRISEGQLPFRDFGIPLGGMYWAIPALFFKIFGAKMITLIKAQVCINIIAGLSFRSILKSLSVNKGIRFASVLLFCISYSFFNFWPWYNHSVIVYELVALACLFRYISGYASMVGSGTAGKWHGAGWLFATAVFICCSFLTKQDGGGMAFFIAGALLACHCYLEKRWMALGIFAGSFVLVCCILILPFSGGGFSYWFNHGQPPHTARISAFDIAEEFFGGSQWIKFYFFLTLALAVVCYRSRAAFLADKKGLLLLILTWAILGEALVFQVTSYTPPDNNIFFHAFAFACIFSLLSLIVPVNFERPRMVVIVTAGIMLWWSGTWWKYTQRVFAKILPHQEVSKSATGENVVNRSTYMIGRNTGDTAKDIPMDQWVECGLPSFQRITMPAPTAAGIHRLLDMDLVKKYREDRGKAGSGGMVNGHPGGLRVLNMSELTPLAAEIPFDLEKNPRLPLWYHLGVGMFNRQADTLETRIREHYYDLILFEYIRNLNNFYPFRIRDSLQLHYRQVDAFMAPRRGPETMGNIEVYIPQ
jgi:hypothetical protein